MGDDARAGRMAVRFSDEDKAWLAEQAEDEGVEPATLVRLIINRLRRGRPLLMSQVVAPAAATPRVQATFVHSPYDAPSGAAATVDDGEAAAAAEDVLAQRLAELEADDGGADVVTLHAEEESAAIPLRRMPRNQYNPGRN